jgi:hypothetical protein
VCGRCYEVPEQMRAEVARIESQAWSTTSWARRPSTCCRRAGPAEPARVPADDIADRLSLDRACTVSPTTCSRTAGRVRTPVDRPGWYTCSRERPDRRDELAAGIGAVRRRIDAACTAAARDPGEITLVVVTKTYPPTTSCCWPSSAS